MNTTVEGRFQHAAYYGLLNLIVYVIISLIMHYANLPQAFGLVSFVAYIAITSIAIRSWVQKQGDLGLDFGKAFLYATIMVLVFIIGYTLWTFVYTQYIGAEKMEEQMLLQQQKLEDRGMDPAQVEAAMSMARKFASPVVIILFSLFGGMIIYSIINLILAAIFKKNSVLQATPFGAQHLPPNFPQHQTTQDYSKFAPPGSNQPPHPPQS